ncbi:MAG: peptidoglycan DD-metalloendopeptidase family protein [bacterium]
MIKLIFNKTRSNIKIIFFICFFIFLNCSFVYSATEEELKEQIQKITETKNQLEQEIIVYEKQIKDIGEQTISLKNTIKSLDATINKNLLDIKLTQNNINSKQLEIEKLSTNIGENIITIKQNTKATALLLNEINKNDNSSFIENFLAYKNLSEFWNEEQSLYNIQNEIQKKIFETKNTKTILENNKVSTEKKKKDLLNFKSNLIDKKKLLDITKKEKKKLLVDTKNSEINFKKILADKKVLAEAFEKELLDFESELDFTIDKNKIPIAKNGILSWPLDIIKITQNFGITVDSKQLYKSGSHNGVDFRASIGTKVKAVSSGIVKGNGNTDTLCKGASFGQWVLIEHNNGLSSVYGHLSMIKVSTGQIVNTGDIIGYSGNTGYSTGPHLHLGVYSTQGVQIMSRKSAVCKGTYIMPIADLKAYLNPLDYLPVL